MDYDDGFLEPVYRPSTTTPQGRELIRKAGETAGYDQAAIWHGVDVSGRGGEQFPEGWFQGDQKDAKALWCAGFAVGAKKYDT